MSASDPGAPVPPTPPCPVGRCTLLAGHAGRHEPAAAANKFDGGVAESNAPVAPGEVRESRPSAAVDSAFASAAGCFPCPECGLSGCVACRIHQPDCSRRADERWLIVGPDSGIVSHSECSRVVVRQDTPKGWGFIIDPDAVRTTDLRTGETRTFREIVEADDANA